MCGPAGGAEIHGVAAFVPLWSTLGAPALAVKSGKWYFEAKLAGAIDPQIGWGDRAFFDLLSTEKKRTCGVGDDNHSWAVDGCRGFIWHDGKKKAFDQQWTDRVTVGCAVDVDNCLMYFSTNGWWDVAATFEKFSFREYLFPACSGEFAAVEFCVVPGDLKFKPPDPSYLPLLPYNRIGDWPSALKKPRAPKSHPPEPWRCPPEPEYLQEVSRKHPSNLCYGLGSPRKSKRLKPSTPGDAQDSLYEITTQRDYYEAAVNDASCREEITVVRMEVKEERQEASTLFRHEQHTTTTTTSSKQMNVGETAQTKPVPVVASKDPVDHSAAKKKNLAPAPADAEEGEEEENDDDMEPPNVDHPPAPAPAVKNTAKEAPAPAPAPTPAPAEKEKNPAPTLVPVPQKSDSREGKAEEEEGESIDEGEEQSEEEEVLDEGSNSDSDVV